MPVPSVPSFAFLYISRQDLFVQLESFPSAGLQKDVGSCAASMRVPDSGWQESHPQAPLQTTFLLSHWVSKIDKNPISSVKALLYNSAWKRSRPGTKNMAATCCYMLQDAVSFCDILPFKHTCTHTHPREPALDESLNQGRSKLLRPTKSMIR